MATNNITTRSYLVKRLKDSGYTVDKLDIKYSPEDKRKYSILMDNGYHSIIITCYKDGYFHFNDGGKSFHKLRYSADSVEVLVDILNSYHIFSKHWSYGKQFNESV